MYPDMSCNSIFSANFAIQLVRHMGRQLLGKEGSPDLNSGTIRDVFQMLGTSPMKNERRKIFAIGAASDWAHFLRMIEGILSGVVLHLEGILTNRS